MTDVQVHSQLIELNENARIEGILEGGLTLAEGVNGDVFGRVLGGHVTVGPRATLNVYGTWQPSGTFNSGTIILSGVLQNLPPSTGGGRCWVAAGSIIMSGGQTYLLHADGSKRMLRAGDSLSDVRTSNVDWLEFVFGYAWEPRAIGAPRTQT